MRFGPDINAGTSFDETSYQLQIPTDRPAVMDTALMILEDWSRDVSLEAEAIDKERGVVVEEWRLGRGAGARMLDKQLPVLLRGSRYAVRLPDRGQDDARDGEARGGPALLSRLVSPRSHGRHRRGRLRAVADGAADSPALWRRAGGRQPSPTDALRPPRSRLDAGRHRHRQGGDRDERHCLREGPHAGPVHARLVPQPAHRRTVHEHAQSAAVRADAEARRALHRRIGIPGQLPRRQGRGDSGRRREGRRHHPRPRRDPHRGRARPTLRLHPDGARPAEGGPAARPRARVRRARQDRVGLSRRGIRFELHRRRADSRDRVRVRSLEAARPRHPTRRGESAGQRVDGSAESRDHGEWSGEGGPHAA